MPFGQPHWHEEVFPWKCRELQAFVEQSKPRRQIELPPHLKDHYYHDLALDLKHLELLTIQLRGSFPSPRNIWLIENDSPLYNCHFYLKYHRLGGLDHFGSSMWPRDGDFRRNWPQYTIVQPRRWRLYMHNGSNNAKWQPRKSNKKVIIYLLHGIRVHMTYVNRFLNKHAWGSLKRCATIDLA